MHTNRLTFGVTCSPFLASRVLLQVAIDYEHVYSLAAEIVQHSFYVVNCLAGAESVEDAVKLREDLNSLLKEHR